MDVALYLGVILVCLALSAFFSGGETALLRLGTHQVDEDAQKGRGPAVLAARDLQKSTSRLLVTLLLGNNVVNILGAAVATTLAVSILGQGPGILVATISMTVLVLIFAEILPKAVAASHPRRVSYAVALPLYLLHQLLRPLHVLFDRVIEPVVRRVAGGSAAEGGSGPEDILRLARTVRESGPHATPLAIIGATAGAADRTVDEIMTPRTEVVAFQSDIKPQTLLEQILEERYTRVPIYEESIDRESSCVRADGECELQIRNQHRG